MDRSTRASHASHDELLIARLYGGDVDDRERARAVEIMADCPDCAELFADLGAIAEATASMPVPARPRDFMLTEEDAARLRRKRRGWQVTFGLGLRRSFGGSLAALGLAGLMLTSAASLLGQTTSASLTSANAPERFAQSSGPNFDSQGAVGLAAASPAAASEPAPAFAAGVTAALAANPAAATTPTTDAANRVPGDVAGDAGGSPPIQTETAAAGVDPRLLWLLGFALLFAIGVAVALLPQRLRRRVRGR
jgi:anti-sigma factor RsiW